MRMVLPLKKAASCATPGDANRVASTAPRISRAQMLDGLRARARRSNTRRFLACDSMVAPLAERWSRIVTGKLRVAHGGTGRSSELVLATTTQPTESGRTAHLSPRAGRGTH